MQAGAPRRRPHILASDRVRRLRRASSTTSPGGRPRVSRSSIFSALILLFTALFSLPIAPPTGESTPLADAFFTAVSSSASPAFDGRHGDALVAVGHVLVYIGVKIGARRRADPRVDPRPGDLASGSACAPSSWPRATPTRCAPTAARRRRPGRAPRRDRRAAAHRGPVDARHRGGHRDPAVPRAAHRRHHPLDALWEALYYSAMAFTNTGFTPERRGARPFANDYWFLTILMLGVFLGAIGFPVIYALRRHLLHAPLVAARQAHRSSRRSCCSSRARSSSSCWSSTTRRPSAR